MRQLLLYITILTIAVCGYASVETSIATDSTTDSTIDSAGDTPSDTTTIDTQSTRYTRLTDNDYLAVASRLGIEVAVIKAVVEVEAGKAQEGFWRDSFPLLNFDLKIFQRYAARNGIKLSPYRKTHPVIFSRPDRRRYGSYQAAQQARFDAACEIDSVTAIEGTFWGMFQIGGFNWKKCGAASIIEFYNLMCESEHAQLDLFAEFLTNCGMVEALRRKNWSQFAYRYNGPRYKARGYHTKLARAYKKHSAQ